MARKPSCQEGRAGDRKSGQGGEGRGPIIVLGGYRPIPERHHQVPFASGNLPFFLPNGLQESLQKAVYKNEAPNRRSKCLANKELKPCQLTRKSDLFSSRVSRATVTPFPNLPRKSLPMLDLTLHHHSLRRPPSKAMVSAEGALRARTPRIPSFQKRKAFVPARSHSTTNPIPEKPRTDFPPRLMDNRHLGFATGLRRALRTATLLSTNRQAEERFSGIPNCPMPARCQ